MLKRTGRKRRLKKRSSIAEELHTPVVMKEINNKKNDSAFYKSGPMLTMHNAKNMPATTTSKLEPINLPPVTGRGSHSEKINNASSVSLNGKTRADFDGGSYETENVRVLSAESCSSCGSGDPCIRARGTLVSRYNVTTTVTLPSVDDFPDLTPCQRVRVQDAIDNVLTPHEQEHVRAFSQYNGVVRTPFDVTLCRSDFNSTVEDMAEQQEISRQESAQAASDALDPFTFTVDIDCDEPSDESSAPEEDNKSPSEVNESTVNEVPDTESEPEEAVEEKI